MVADIPYFVLLVLLALVINWALHVVTMFDDPRANRMALVQMAVAFGVGVVLTIARHGQGVLAALGFSPGAGIDAILTGLALAAGTDNLNILQSLGAAVPKKAEAGPVPDVVQVEGSVTVLR